MRILYRYFVYGLLLAWGVSGCAKNELPDLSGEDVDLRLQVAPSIGNMQTKVSETPTGYQFDPEDAIGVFATVSGEAPVPSNRTFNARFSYDGAVWSAAEEVYWPSGTVGTPCCLLAYYPYQDGVTSASAIPFGVSIDQSTEKQMMANDFLVSRTLADKADRAITMEMSHLLSMITVNVAYQSDHIQDVACSLKIDTRTQMSVDMTQWPAQFTVSGATQTLTPFPLETPSGGYDRSWSVIVPPQSVEASVPFLKVIYGSQEIPLPLNKTFQSGFHYSVNLKLGIEGELTLEGISVSQWDETITVNNGRVEDLTVYNTGDVIVYQEGTVADPVVLVVTGEGFIREQMLKNGYFEQMARKGLDYLFNAEPYKTYRHYFTVYIIPAISNEEGVGDWRAHIQKDTYFGISTGESFSGAYSIYDRKPELFLKEYCPDIVNGRVTYDQVPLAILANDSRRGGVTSSSPAGAAYAICPLTPGEWISELDNIREQIGEEIGVTIETWPNVFLHEVGGHAIGRLGDEYWYDNDEKYIRNYISEHSWTVPMCLNLTCDPSPTSTSVYWRHMIGDSRFPKVGFYEGGYAEYGKGIWRSEKISCMIDDRPYFNACSCQLIVERIKKLSNEAFDYEDFLAKDVNYDEVLDQLQSGAYSNDYGKYSRRDLPVYPLREPPVLLKD